VADFLRGRGLLGPDCEVVDVGCGPGRFAAEFARTARRVVGLDFSLRMIEAGRRFTRGEDLHNVDFQVSDFQEADAVPPDLAGSFDLAFSSITPAIAGVDALQRFMGLSRAWCMNICFVHTRNDLHDRILRDLFERPPRRENTGHSHWFPELFNLLWCWGYYPETNFRSQPRELALQAGPEHHTRIERFLRDHADADGVILERSECRYGWTLWDVRARTGHPRPAHPERPEA
jgi:SAM-dependent methyltransferase